jgi:hypothetical protein
MLDTLIDFKVIVKEIKKMPTTRYLLLWGTFTVSVVLYKSADIITAVTGLLALK